LLVGIGPGGVDQLTVEAVQALNACDAFLVVDKDVDAATGDLERLRQEILDRHVTRAVPVVHVADPPRDRSVHQTSEGYERAVEEWHDARAAAYHDAVASAVPDEGTVGLLVWGDPAFYDSNIRILDRVEASGADVDHAVVPGVGAISLLAARHRLVLNTVGSAVTVTTGRRLLEAVEAGADNVVVMLDGSLACSRLATEQWDVWWGANLGTSDESLVAGPLDAVLPDIEKARAATRAARGWVMDTYLLRRR
jgi:precorrin-6A synthase